LHSLLTRHAAQVLIAAGHTQDEVAAHCKLSVRTVRRILQEKSVDHVDDQAERRKRGIGRPSKTESLRPFVAELLAQEPELLAVEVVRRCKLRGYAGGKSAIYALVAELRPKPQELLTRFDGLPGEFSQHDFGQVDVRFTDGTVRRVHFFASRLKHSRYAAVSVVPDERTETLVRTLLDHFVAFGGVPLCAVFDRPRTVALKWGQDGVVTEWNPVFAYAAMEIGFTAEACWPYSPRQKGAVENLVGWVKGSFFKQRRFLDQEDLEQQLHEWLQETNEQRPSRATNVVPAVRREEERPRLRAPKVSPAELALRIPVSVGPTAYVVHDGHPYSMPPEAAGLPGTLFLHRDRVRIVAGRFSATHDRKRGGEAPPSTLPEHRASQLAALSGKRGKRYLKRQHLFDIGEAAERFLTELVHRDPHGWSPDVDRLHDLLQRYGAEAMHRALRAAADIGRFDVDYVARCLGASRPAQPSLFDKELGA
jgi:transposase